MLNASRCRRMAARYAELAETSDGPDVARAYRELERLWTEMAPLAEAVDRRGDWRARERIYAMIDVVEQIRHQVA